MNQKGDLHFQSVFEYDDLPPPPPPDDELEDFNFQTSNTVNNNENIESVISSESNEVLNRLKELDPSQLVIVCNFILVNFCYY